MKFSTVAIALSLLLAPVAGVACAFHAFFYQPERTVIDWIIESEELVLARPDPEDEFSFAMTERLRGSLLESPDLPYLVDSTSRRRLAANPDDAVLFATDEYGAWNMIAYVDDELHPLVETALLEADTWKGAYPRARFTVFAGLQNHPDPGIRKLALGEIDQAPYEFLQEKELRIPLEELRLVYWMQEGLPYLPLRILLLGLSDSAQARAEVHQFIDRAANGSMEMVLGAYATALVELDGSGGVERLEKKLLSDHDQPLFKIEQVVEALAIHNGSGTSELKVSIDAALQRLVEIRPAAAGLVARQFSNRGDWSQAGLLESVISSRDLRASTDVQSIASYLVQARKAPVDETSNTPGT